MGLAAEFASDRRCEGICNGTQISKSLLPQFPLPLNGMHWVKGYVWNLGTTQVYGELICIPKGYWRSPSSAWILYFCGPVQRLSIARLGGRSNAWISSSTSPRVVRWLANAGNANLRRGVLQSVWIPIGLCATHVTQHLASVKFRKRYHAPVRQLRKGHFRDPERLLGLNSKSQCDRVC